MLKFLGNLVWLIFTGLFSAIGYVLEGVLWCVSIIGIPFGLQCFKLARLTLLPFGATLNVAKSHPIANIIWFIFGGFVFVIGYSIAGLLWCITIVGIPFGKQCFKLARLSLSPFGKEVN